jgi:hypothetical protein
MYDPSNMVLTTVPTRIALAFEMLTPLQVCRLFSRALNRPVRYVEGEIDIKVSIPAGYKEQLDGIASLFGHHKAPYFGPDLEGSNVLDDALELWEGYRGIEEYAREIFPEEERANGMKWMDEDEDMVTDDIGVYGDDEDDGEREEMNEGMM